MWHKKGGKDYLQLRLYQGADQGAGTAHGSDRAVHRGKTEPREAALSVPWRTGRILHDLPERNVLLLRVQRERRRDYLRAPVVSSRFCGCAASDRQRLCAWIVRAAISDRSETCTCRAGSPAKGMAGAETCRGTGDRSVLGDVRPGTALRDDHRGEAAHVARGSTVPGVYRRYQTHRPSTVLLGGIRTGEEKHH